MRRLLPKIIAVLTRHPRYLVTHGKDFEWAQHSWTYNSFRVYELVFGRRDGIKAELSYNSATGVYACHSWEAAFALFEDWVRGAFKFKLPVKVWIPILATPQGVPVFASPYLFAIAWDAAQTNKVSPVNSGTYTCTGSNGKLFMGLFDGTGASDGITGVTYNSVALTMIADSHVGSFIRWLSLWYLDAPATGSNSFSISASGGFNTVLISSYSGCTTGIDSSATPSLSTTATSFNIPTTVVAANCWLISTGGNDAAANVAGTGTTQRANDDNNGNMLCDSNGTVGTGSQQLNMTSSVAGHWVTCVASFAPVATAAKSITSDIVLFN